MEIPLYSSIILNTQTQIDAFTQSFTFKGYEALVAYLQKPVAALCVLYIILMGYGIILGYVKTPIDAFKKIILRMGVIYMFAFNWGIFSQYFFSLFIDVSSEIAAVIMKANPSEIPIDGNGINGALQSVLTEVIRVGSWFFEKATFRHWSPAFMGAVIEWAGMAVVGFAFFELIIAKVMLSVCLCFAPLFFVFTLFDQTKSFFDKWLGALVGFALVFVFVSAIVGLCMYLLHMAVSPHYADHAAHVDFTTWVPILFIAALGIMMIFEVAGIAKSIGGACSTSHSGAMIGGFIGSALGAARMGKSGGSLMKNIAGKGLGAAKAMASGGGRAMKSIQNKIRGGK